MISKRRLLLALSATALLLPMLAAPPRTGEASPGPGSDLLARVQWVRFQQARVAGETDRALAHAQSALRLAPRDPAGWELLSSHLGLFLASPEREPSPERRLAWFRMALATLDEGLEATQGSPGLWMSRGLLLRSRAEFDPELPWPGGAQELWRLAADAFDQAAKQGTPGAADLARHARDPAR